MSILGDTLAILLKAHWVNDYCPECKVIHKLIACNRADNGKPFRLCPLTLNVRDLKEGIEQ